MHCKSVPAQEVCAVLTVRKLLQGKHHDVEINLRGIPHIFGLKVGAPRPRPIQNGSEHWSKVIPPSR